MLKSIILSLVLSADAFGAGIAFGTVGIKINRSSKAVLSAVSLLAALISVAAGREIFQHIPYKAVSAVSALMLIVPGMFFIKQSIRFNPNKKYRLNFLNIINSPESCDSDFSKKIEPKEAVILSLALSADNICAMASCGFNGRNIFYIPFFLTLFQLVLLNCGLNTGEKINGIHRENHEKWIFISGTLLILLGISNFFNI